MQQQRRRYQRRHGQRRHLGTHLIADGPAIFNQTTRTVTSWTGRVQGAQRRDQVRVTVTALCLAVPAG